MSLKSLEKFDVKAASGILADIALSANNPGVGIAATLGHVAERDNPVLAEIRDRLKISSEDSSPDSRAKIQEIISIELSRLLLLGKDRDEIFARAGQGGRLPVSMYRLHIAPFFMRQFGEFGVKESHLRQTILTADAHQHLMTGESYQNSEEAMSLFLKWQKSKDGLTYCTLAMANRKGENLFAQHLWRIVPNDLNIALTAKPVDFLAAFCEKFGLDVSIGEKKQKFFLQESVSFSGENQKFDWKVEGSVRHMTTLSHRLKADGKSWDIGLIYAIDLERYKNSLREHKLI